jgi:SAM-dependent methyltransferase
MSSVHVSLRQRAKRIGTEFSRFSLQCGHRLRRVLGYREEQWVRTAQIDEWVRFLSNIHVAKLDALEISPADESRWRTFGFKSYQSVQFPPFDIMTQTLGRTFDVVIAEQVFEHLKDPYSAARNVWKMLNDDGVFLIATPFLIRIHNYPGDYTRWTPAGLEVFLTECGFDAEVKSWGNKKAVIANLDKWPSYGWRRDMTNQPDFPAVVWAFARKAAHNAAPDCAEACHRTR